MLCEELGPGWGESSKGWFAWLHQEQGPPQTPPSALAWLNENYCNWAPKHPEQCLGNTLIQKSEIWGIIRPKNLTPYPPSL